MRAVNLLKKVELAIIYFNACHDAKSVILKMKISQIAFSPYLPYMCRQHYIHCGSKNIFRLWLFPFNWAAFKLLKLQFVRIYVLRRFISSIRSWSKAMESRGCFSVAPVDVRGFQSGKCPTRQIPNERQSSLPHDNGHVPLQSPRRR